MKCTAILITACVLSLVTVQNAFCQKADAGQNSKTASVVLPKKAMLTLNIAAAESGRGYGTWTPEWTAGQPKPADWPSYLMPRDQKNKPGAFPVAFWHPEWKDVVIYGKQATKSLLDTAINSGAQGIYLDGVDALNSEQVQMVANLEGVDPAAEMTKFIDEMRAYAKKRNPKFVIVVRMSVDSPATSSNIQLASRQ